MVQLIAPKQAQTVTSQVHVIKIRVEPKIPQTTTVCQQVGITPTLLEKSRLDHNIKSDGHTYIVLIRHAVPSRHKTRRRNNFDTNIKNRSDVILARNHNLLPPPDCIYSSPYPRTLQTAQVWFEESDSSQIIQDHRLSELERYHLNPTLSHNDPENNLSLSISQRFELLDRRIKQFIQDVQSSCPGKIVYIFSHGVVINRIYEILTGSKIAPRGRLVPHVTPFICNLVSYPQL